jgi:hypothetical protein
MTDLLLKTKGKPGRPRTVTAHAWIDRKRPTEPWKSHVYVGNARVHVLTTATTDRTKALDFNRCHLIQALQSKLPTTTTTPEHQLHLELLTGAA